ncbi:hypothetical protein JOD43_000042 [Pullulanibacillus pueri]|nr:hypothetical protein [Pullulanibacillus pueri]
MVGAPLRGGDASMSVYQALMIMLTFGLVIIALLQGKEK